VKRVNSGGGILNRGISLIGIPWSVGMKADLRCVKSAEYRKGATMHSILKLKKPVARSSFNSLGWNERRVCTRFPVSVLVKCVSKNQHMIAESFNISAKGLGLITNEELSCGSRVNMFVLTPGSGEKVAVQGRVVWAENFGFGKYKIGIALGHTELKPVTIVLRVVENGHKYH